MLGFNQGVILLVIVSTITCLEYLKNSNITLRSRGYYRTIEDFTQISEIEEEIDRSGNVIAVFYADSCTNNW
jgi:hypothetical protein